MATRTVSIKIVLDGYQQYRSSIAALNAQNKLLDAQLKDIDAQYGKNSTSVDALARKQELLAQKHEIAKKKLAESEDMLDKSTKAMTFYGNAVEVGKQEVEKATKALQDYKNGTYEGSESLEQLEENQRSAVASLSEALRMYTQSSNETARLTKEVTNLKKETGEYTPEVDENTKALQTNADQVVKSVDVWQRFKDILGFAKDAVGKVKDAVMDSINAFIDYEAAFTGVEKTVDGSQRQLAKLNDQIKEMSSTMPFAAKDIATIASLAGQLGVGVNDIRDFTEVMLGLGTATNLTAEDASTMLAQFQNVTGFEADKIKNIASVIVDLGNNSATTERDIMEMAQRFASAGTLAGLSAPEILGMSAALSSVGIRAEAGGTSLSKLTQNIQKAVETESKDLEQFARVAGVNADKFAKAWKESPIEAINMFINGLHETYEEGDPVLELLDKVGFGEIRLRNATQALASSEKGLAYYVDMANNAFGDTVAYDTEVGRFLETTQSNVQILKNNFELLKIQLGEALAPAFDDLVSGAGTFVEKLSLLIEQNPIIIEAISQIIGVFTGVLDILGLVIDEFTTYEGNIERFGSVANSTSDAINNSTRAYADQTKAIDDTYTEAQKYLDVLADIERDGKVTRDEQEKYNDAIEELKKLFPELNIEIDKKTGKIKGGTDAIREQIDAWRDLAMAEAKQKRMISLYEQLYDVQAELSENTKKFKDNQRELDRIERERESKGERYIYLTNRRKDLTKEEGEELKKLHQYMIDSKDRMEELEQEQADLEVAIVGGKDAINDSWTAIKNWEGAIDDATKATEDDTKATQENADAHEKAADSYDQSAKAEEGGKKTTEAYARGVQGYSTSATWNSIMNAVRSGVYASFGDAATAYKKGQEIAKEIGAGIKSSVGSIKEAGRQINEALANTIRKNYKWKMQMQNGTANYVAMFAEGGVVNRATPAIVGEAGTEAIIPLKKLPDIMTKYMQNQQSMNNFYGARSSSQQRDVDTIVSLLNRYLPKMSNQQVVLDSTKLVGTLAPKMDTYFTNQLIAEGRGQ